MKSLPKSAYKDSESVSGSVSSSQHHGSSSPTPPLQSSRPPQRNPVENAKSQHTPAAKKSTAPLPPTHSSLEPGNNATNQTQALPRPADITPTENASDPLSTPPEHHVPMATTPPSGGFGLPYGTQPGTLSDLKKKRAQELRDSMRFKEAQIVKQKIQSYNQNYNNPMQNATNGGGSNVASPQSNGQNGTVSSRRGSDASYYGGVDPPKHKFTASTQEIVGGSDNKTGCCVVQ